MNPTYHGDQGDAIINTSSVSTKPVQVSLLHPLKTMHMKGDALSMFLFVLQESKWSLFMKKLKPSTTFENPSYSEVRLERINREFRCSFGLFNLCVVLQMKDEKPVGSSGEPSAPEPSPFVPPPKPQKRDRPSTFSPTEDSFKDTANLVKEDSDV